MNGTRVSRRTFLAGAAAAAVGNSAFGLPSQVPPVRVGLVGCGAEGMRLLHELRRCGAVVSVAYDVAERRKHCAALAAGAHAAADWRGAIERRDVDAVVIATPPHLHASIAIAAMEAGKHVYCASPMALGLEDARAFRDCAVRTGRIVQIGAEPAGEGQWRTARTLIRSGIIGDVMWCQGRYRAARHVVPTGMGRIDWDAFHAGAPHDIERLVQWRRYWDYSAGAAAESHFDEMAALLCAVDASFPVRVSAAGGVYAEDGRETPDSFVMAAEYAGGVTIVLASTARATTATIRGSKGSLELRGAQVRVVRETKTGPIVESHRAEATRALVEDWLAAIRTGTPCVCDAELGYRAMVAIAMAVEAYRQRKTFSFDTARGIMTRESPRIHA